MKKLLKREHGITLIALVVTIIVLLILAGISISMLTGQNGIITNASNANMQSDYSQAEENVKLAYMAIKTEIMTQKTTNSSYDATDESKENPEKLAKMVAKELTGSETIGNNLANTRWTIINYDSSKTTINIRYTNASLKKNGIKDGIPNGDGYADFKIKLKPQDAEISIDTSSGDENNQTQNEAKQDMFFYEIISENEKTASISGINFEYIFSGFFGENQSEWPEIELSESSNSNIQYKNALNQYINNMILPSEVKLNSYGEYNQNGETYSIIEVKKIVTFDEKYPSDNPSRRIWGTGYHERIDYILEDSSLNFNVVIPEGVRYIRSAIFVDGGGFWGTLECKALKSIQFPSTLEELDSSALLYCTSLSEVEIPSSIVFHGPEAFYRCSNLKTITAPVGKSDCGDGYSIWPSALETFIANGGSSTAINEFSFCENLNSVTLPNTLTTIEEGTFWYCTSLEELYIPDSVDYIGNNAFYGSGITNLSIPSKLVGEDDYYSNWGISDSSVIHVRNN